jgi:osmotically inducible lipoprotein OsmB
MKQCLILILAVSLLASACVTTTGPTTNSVITGGALGAGSGALIGAAAGNAGTGAAIGAGAGVLGGFLYDQWRRNQGLGPYGQ